MKTYTIINPATGKPIREAAFDSQEAVDQRLERCTAQLPAWTSASVQSRVAPILRIASLLRERSDSLARLMAEEMGKPVSQGKSEAEKCAWVCAYYAEHADEFLKPEMIETDASTSYVTFEPLGIILAIMPWNFPFWQVFRCAIPAMAAGNGILLKHAPNVPECARAIRLLFEEAGFPIGLLSSVMVDNEQAEALIDHPQVSAVTLTGSTRAGKAVAARAGRSLKKCVLELGGSDPYIILENADIGHAAECCVASKLINSGQSCVAAKRFIVMESVLEEFTGELIARMGAAIMGDPLEKNTVIGPLARKDLQENLHRQVTESVAAGAEVLLGGILPEGSGCYYPATVISNVKKGMPLCDEEIFGPVAAIISVKDSEEAVQIANDSPYGLGAAVFTNNLEKAEALAADHILAGCCFINDFVKSDPRLPFGGIKESGYGRELSHYGIKEFVNAKTVYIR